MRLEFFAHGCDPGAAGIDSARLESASAECLPPCLEHSGPHEAPLPSLESIEINLVSDEVIAQVHAEFLDDPAPTDVITFQHGEIFLSIETAARSAGIAGHPVTRETLLYVIHGFLHLNGHHDEAGPERERMHRIQDSILQNIWPFPEP